MLSRKQKKKIGRFFSLLVGAGILIVGGILITHWLTYRKAKRTRYPEFGIVIPGEYAIHGIDVSKYQQVIAWEEVQKMQVQQIKLGFTFIKATEGIGNTDENFSRNWKKSKQQAAAA